MLRLAGLRLNPLTNGRHHPPHNTGISLVSVQDGKERNIALPANPYLNVPEWSPNGQRFVFTNTTNTDNATMPVVGDPETMNNTYVEQIVASAKAAVDKAVERA